MSALAGAVRRVSHATMPTFDIYSKRRGRQSGESPDVYQYAELPTALRVQLVHILVDLLQGGSDANLHRREVEQAYDYICRVLCREHGVFRLWGSTHAPRDHALELASFILNEQNVERVLDALEVSLGFADRYTRDGDYIFESDPDLRVDDAINELNTRFREHAVGYQYEDGEFVRVDSDLLHLEAVKPALQLLRTAEYAGPRQEFLAAHEHYRHGRHEEALTESLKSFESTMKAICDQKNWTYKPNDGAKNLVAVCLSNGLIAEFWQTNVSGLRSTLESGIATVRNKLGGHGQGSKTREVPGHIVAYALHMTASTIVFLIESAESM